MAGKIGLDLLILDLAGAGVGIGVGILTANGHTMDRTTDPTPYQNFGVLAGAALGVAGCIVAAAVYWLLTRLLLRKPGFHRRLYLLHAAIAGAAICAGTYALVSASAGAYGMVMKTGWVTVFDGVVSAFLGGLVGVAAAAALTMVRAYD